MHCPKEVVEEVSANAAATALSRKQNVLMKDQRDQANARSAILRLFPRIPLQDVDIVLGHGFAKGTGRVGRTGTLSMDEKVTMAVTAHVRHTHTSYDSILSGQGLRKGTKSGRRQEARAQIRHGQNAVLKSWRGSKAREAPKMTRALGPAPPERKVNPKASHRAINRSTSTEATETRKRRRTVDLTGEALPISKRPKRRAAIAAEAILSQGQRRVSHQLSEEFSEEYIDLLSDDAGDADDDDNDSGDDVCKRPISVTKQSPPTSILVSSKRAHQPSSTNRAKTRQAMGQSQRSIDRTKKYRRGLDQRMKAAEDSSARANALDAVPDLIIIGGNHGDKHFSRRKWEEKPQSAEDNDDCVVLFECPVIKPPGRRTNAGTGAARRKRCKD